MQRVKSFEATGLAPNGRLYAGDLNAIQDAAAAKADFTQTIDLANLRIGETALQLLKYGPAEARISGSLRTDGIVRALGGLYGGAFSTAARDALTNAQRPYGLIILNTTTNGYEFNSGTESSPVWTPFITTVPQGELTGVMKMWPTTTPPAGYLLCDGSAVSRTTYSALNALFTPVYTYGAGDGSTTFNLPDLRGRMPVGLGTNGDVDSLAENEGESVANRRPKHKHTASFIGTPSPIPGSNGLGGPNNVPTGAFNPEDAIGLSVGPQSNVPTDSPAFLVVNFIIKT
jgi:microcystin-dependent protein